MRQVPDVRSLIFVLSLLVTNACSSTNFAGNTGAHAQVPQGAMGTGTNGTLNSVGSGIAPAIGTIGAGGTAISPASSIGATAGAYPLPSTITVPVATSVMYANTTDALYSLATPTAPATLVGHFSLNGGGVGEPIYDLGIDSAGHLFAVSPTRLFAVNPQTAELQMILYHGLSQANGLTVLSTGAIVIAGNGVSILAPNASVPTQLVPGGQYVSSGDVIALPDHMLYWSVTGNGSDRLVKIDPSTGQTTLLGSMGVSGVWGLGYAAGTLYGFCDNGDVVGLSTTNGAASAAVGNDNDQWTGATTNPVAW